MQDKRGSALRPNTGGGIAELLPVGCVEIYPGWLTQGARGDQKTD